MIAKKNQTPSEKGYDTDYASTSKTHTDRIVLQSPFKGQKHESSRRKSKPRKPQPKTRKQVELGSSDNLTRTRVSGLSSKPARRQTRRSKKSTTSPPPPGYLASDESMLIPSDISDTSDWEWIAGGFPCRDVARERFISDSCKTKTQNGITLNPSLPKNNIKTEILEDINIQAGDQFGD